MKSAAALKVMMSRLEKLEQKLGQGLQQVIRLPVGETASAEMLADPRVLVIERVIIDSPNANATRPVIEAEPSSVEIGGSRRPRRPSTSREPPSSINGAETGLKGFSDPIPPSGLITKIKRIFPA